MKEILDNPPDWNIYNPGSEEAWNARYFFETFEDGPSILTYKKGTN